MALTFIQELNRRNVLRVGAAYVVVAWLLIQVTETIFPLYGFGDTPARIVTTVLAIGLIPSLVFAWAFELTPEGFKRDEDVDRTQSIAPQTGKKLDRMIMVVLALALGLFAFDKFVLDPARDAKEVASARQQGRTEALVESYGDKSIVVLPFTDLSPAGDQEYFSDGLAEELLNLLAQFHELRVISRRSAFSFKGKNVATPEVAEQLDVAHVLEGSVRRDGNRVRITAQLIEAQTDSHLWSQTYDSDLGDIFAVQDEIATAISDALKVKLSLVSGTSERPYETEAVNTDAYDAYLRARELIHSRGPDNIEEAVNLLERSVRLDNNFAPAHAQLAIAMALLGEVRQTPLEEVMPIIIPHLDRAHELDPDSAEAHAGRALLVLSIDAESAVEHARKALALNPSYGDALHWLQLALYSLGRYEEANEVVEQILVKDPLSVVGRLSRAEWLSKTGKFEEAHEIADQFLAENLDRGYELHANISLTHQGNIADGLSWALKGEVPHYTLLAFMLVGEFGEARRVSGRSAFVVDRAEGRFDTGIDATQKALQRNPNHRRDIWDAAEFLYDSGRVNQALPLYERLLDFVAEGRPVPSSMDDIRSANETTMRLALARRISGDEAGAQAAAEIARLDHAALNAAGAKGQFQQRTEAMIAAFDHHPDRAFAAIESAIRLGLRDRQFLDDAIFEGLWNQDPFIALRDHLNAVLNEERNKVLRLICLNNPAPKNWQPMQETCNGTER